MAKKTSKTSGPGWRAAGTAGIRPYRGKAWEPGQGGWWVALAWKIQTIKCKQCNGTQYQYERLARVFYHKTKGTFSKWLKAEEHGEKNAPKKLEVPLNEACWCPWADGNPSNRLVELQLRAEKANKALEKLNLPTSQGRR